MALLVSLALVAAVLFSVLANPALAAGPDVLVNGSFESGDGMPSGWSTNAWQPSAVFSRDSSMALDGTASGRIDHPDENDSFWFEELWLQPDTPYLVSGSIKTDNVSADGEGANLSLIGTWQHTAGVHGTTDWTQVGMIVDSGPTGVIVIGARLGYWSATSTGTAWFDALQVNRLDPADAPAWKIQLVVADEIDAHIVDANGIEHHVRSTIEPASAAAAIDAARNFVTVDIPALDSGNMVPVVLPPTVTDTPLASLSSLGGGEYWPSPDDTRAVLDPAADSVIVVWNPWGVDVDSGQPMLLSPHGGLTPDMSTGQTYATVIVGLLSEHRNVFKHEFGHSLLSYFEAIGASPVPTVQNHAEATDYVHCVSGVLYDWRDETLADPIPNSIYSNDGGFTHDYYSGTTALATNPGQCLGIPPTAWALGGPVSKPVLPPPPEVPPPSSARDQLTGLTTTTDTLLDMGSIRRHDAKPLLEQLRQASRELDRRRTASASRHLSQFVTLVEHLDRRHRISADTADHLTNDATAIIALLDSEQPDHHRRHPTKPDGRPTSVRLR